MATNDQGAEFDTLDLESGKEQNFLLILVMNWMKNWNVCKIKLKCISL